jgi:hypothetical protein
MKMRIKNQAETEQQNSLVGSCNAWTSFAVLNEAPYDKCIIFLDLKIDLQFACENCVPSACVSVLDLVFKGTVLIVLT